MCVDVCICTPPIIHLHTDFPLQILNHRWEYTIISHSPSFPHSLCLAPVILASRHPIGMSLPPSRPRHGFSLKAWFFTGHVTIVTITI